MLNIYLRLRGAGNLRTAVAASVFATASVLSAQHAQATNITFDLVYDGYASPFEDQGYLFTSDAAISSIAFVSWGSSGAYSSLTAGQPQPDGTATLADDYYSATTTLTKAGGGAFNLDSIDFADLYNSGAALNITFDFTSTSGSGVRSYTLDSLAGLETVYFNLSDLLSISWSGNSPSSALQWDNVRVSSVAATPLPAALPLFLSAVAALGFAAKKRREARE